MSDGDAGGVLDGARPDHAPDQELIERLAALPKLASVPRGELAWLVAHGERQLLRAGNVIAPKARPVDWLYVILSGHIAIRVDRGAGPRRVMDWRTGDVTGMLPYSRMKGSPGDNYLEEDTEVLAVHADHFPELIQRCPTFTAYTVHLMLDRARSFNTSDLQDEKMVSLGKLAAGLAHELNNPASATVRASKLLLARLTAADGAARALGALRLDEARMRVLQQVRAACVARPADAVLSPLEQADREDEIAEWLERHDADPAGASPLADTAVTLGQLDELAGATTPETLEAALDWIASGCTAYSLATDIERAATRISELVGAVKRFTHMDNLAGPEFVDVEPGLRDTLRVVASKARGKEASISLDVDPDLPTVHATGGELNQVWLNLIDNALDAIAQGGHVEITARRELDRVVVRIIDDGPGIPGEVMPRIFDPFFTTKAPGEGTGLGLEIARRLVRRFQGELGVQSKPGRTEFQVSLLAD